MTASVYLLNSDTVTLRSFNCQQKVMFKSLPTANDYKLSLDGIETAAIDYNASASDIQSAFKAIGFLVYVTGGYDTYYLITFLGFLAGTNVNKLIVVDNNTSKNIDIIYTARGRGELGEWLEGIETEKNIKGSVQPMTGKELNIVPEGDRTREIYEFYTQEAISENNLVVYNDKLFEINKVEKWSFYYYCWLVSRRPA